jgi:hypothetical protein
MIDAAHVKREVQGSSGSRRIQTAGIPVHTARNIIESTNKDLEALIF